MERKRPGYFWSGKPRRYDHDSERRILAQLDQPPPKGYATWTGTLVAAALPNISDDEVWRVLRKHGISLQRRRSWCISTDPEFASKAADVVGLYLSPPEHALVLSIDEKPSIQALERAQGWIRLPDGRAMNGFSHCYKRHGTTTLFAALDIVTGQVKTGHYNRRRRREFLDFLNEVVSQHAGHEIHVVLDNLNTHKPKPSAECITRRQFYIPATSPQGYRRLRGRLQPNRRTLRVDQNYCPSLSP